MKKLIAAIILTSAISSLYCQGPVGSWTDHLPYNKAMAVAAGMDEVYASTGSSLLVYNTKNGELRKVSEVNGLSETGISTIGWSEENGILIVAYTNSNLDLIKGNTVINIPDILNSTVPEVKKINRIRSSEGFAYLATSFGVVVLDILKAEIRDTWKPGPGPEDNEVFDVAIAGNTIYAATNYGTWSADLSNQGLAYYANWTLMTQLPDPGSKFNHVIYSGNTLYLNNDPQSSGDKIYAVSDGVILFQDEGVVNTSFDPAPEGFTVSSSGSLKYFSPEGSLLRSISTYGWGNPDISQALITGRDIWIGDKGYGLIHSRDYSGFSILGLPGPASENAVYICSAKGRTIICGGGTDDLWKALGRRFEVSVNENLQFTNHISGDSHDAMRAVIDPKNSSHYFITSWGKGLYEYNGNTLVKHYDATNSPLQNSISNGSDVLVCGAAFDRNGYLWMIQSDVSENIKVLKPDGSWIIFPFQIDAPVATDILITSKEQKWVILPGGHGLFILDDNKTPAYFSDDRFRLLTVIDNDNRVIPFVFSEAEDLDGNVWIGTDQGPVIYLGSQDMFETDVKGYRIKVPRNDGSGLADYMLGTETVTSISIDGADRKWLGTKNSGAYLLSPDGTEMIKNYNRKNSPLFSDSIATVSINNVSGEVWLGTSKGVLSVRELATEGKEGFSQIYAFPNPVREDYYGNVTITGLVSNSEIKITDVSGNLVYETTSEGGQASWDLTTYNGRRVSTGVYVVFCTNEEGSESGVTKILVIGN